MAECECELSSQSEHQSPGIVQDEESLVRVIYSPDQINTDGTLISANFNKDEFQRPANGDPPKEGFSTFRAGHATDDQIRDLAASQMIKLPSARKEAWAFKAVKRRAIGTPYRRRIGTPLFNARISGEARSHQLAQRVAAG